MDGPRRTRANLRLGLIFSSGFALLFLFAATFVASHLDSLTLDTSAGTVYEKQRRLQPSDPGFLRYVWIWRAGMGAAGICAAFAAWRCYQALRKLP